jgi:hypothetical protein
MNEAKLISNSTHVNGKFVETFAVEYKTPRGLTFRTLFTKSREEACAWGRIIRHHGYCASARPMPTGE